MLYKVGQFVQLFPLIANCDEYRGRIGRITRLHPKASLYSVKVEGMKVICLDRREIQKTRRRS